MQDHTACFTQGLVTPTSDNTNSIRAAVGARQQDYILGQAYTGCIAAWLAAGKRHHKTQQATMGATVTEEVQHACQDPYWHVTTVCSATQCKAADLPGGAMTGGRSSPGMEPAGAAAAVLLPEVDSILSLWEGEARLEPACEAPPSRASRGRLAGVRGQRNLHPHACFFISRLRKRASQRSNDSK